MARIVFGMGVSHSPMLGCSPDEWTTVFRKGDENNTLLWFRKKHMTYHEIVEARREEQLDQYLTLDETRRRHAASLRAQDEMMRICHEVRPDVLVIIGNDHREVFTTVTPAFGIYTGATHENRSVEPPNLFEGVFTPGTIYGPEQKVSHDHVPGMAQHVVGAMMRAGFDITVIEETPTQGPDKEQITPHAFGFVYHHLFKDQPPPSLPIHINTFFPPNQPSMERVFAFSEALADAIESWDSDLTVGIIGSGGLSHFIVDEELDRKVIDALEHDINRLRTIDEDYYQSGTSEVKNWVPVAVAMQRLKVPMTLVGYTPCYRSPAGNGHGMAFAYWRA
jgi:Catalytic LigB subunit of aromatic ring-opening dioxygenase